jgi:hypothetical protein
MPKRLRHFLQPAADFQRGRFTSSAISNETEQ